MDLKISGFREGINTTTSFPLYCDTLRNLIYLYNLKEVKNSHGGVLHLIKLQAKASNFIKRNTPSWEFFTFFKSYKWYQMGWPAF